MYISATNKNCFMFRKGVCQSLNKLCYCTNYYCHRLFIYNFQHQAMCKANKLLRNEIIWWRSCYSFKKYQFYRLSFGISKILLFSMTSEYKTFVRLIVSLRQTMCRRISLTLVNGQLVTLAQSEFWDILNAAQFELRTSYTHVHKWNFGTWNII